MIRKLRGIVSWKALTDSNRIRTQLYSLNFQITRLFRARSSLILKQLQSVDSLWNGYVTQEQTLKNNNSFSVWFCEACYLSVPLGSYALWCLPCHASGDQWLVCKYTEKQWFFWVLWVPFMTHWNDLLVCICQNYLIDTIVWFCKITIEKEFSTMILKYLEKTSWRHAN